MAESVEASGFAIGGHDKSLDENRFGFGKNWSQYLDVLTEERIEAAKKSVIEWHGDRLEGKTLIDVGSGSGLFSLVARQLGANVLSFDYDQDSVGCTQALRDKHFPGDPSWTIKQGSVLDENFVSSLGTFDIVYSWGVLHHTGDMWRALQNVVSLVNDAGRLHIAIYNDQGHWSSAWKTTKKAYNSLPESLRFLVLWPCAARIFGVPMIRSTLTTGNPLKLFKEAEERGMSLKRDLVDWVGGYPFEVAKPEEIFDFYKGHGFVLEKMKTCGPGKGCNEFKFSKQK